MTTLEQRQKRAANARAMRALKRNNRNKMIEVLGALGEKTLDILDSMIQASVSNPLMGIAGSMIIGDILYRAKAIDIQTFAMIGVSAGVLEGAGVAGGIIQDVSDFFHIFQSQSQSPDPISPSATTVVFGNKSGDLQALMRDVNQK